MGCTSDTHAASAPDRLSDTGDKYISTTNTWVATSLSNAPSEREFHSAVWTGSEMIVWGGLNNVTFDNTVEQIRYSYGELDGHQEYERGEHARGKHTGIWTGSEMIAWGGELGSGSATDTGGTGKLERSRMNAADSQSHTCGLAPK